MWIVSLEICPYMSHSEKGRHPYKKKNQQQLWEHKGESLVLLG